MCLYVCDIIHRVLYMAGLPLWQKNSPAYAGLNISIMIFKLLYYKFLSTHGITVLQDSNDIRARSHSALQ